jgi:hypothetical protein
LDGLTTFAGVEAAGFVVVTAVSAMIGSETNPETVRTTRAILFIDTP